MPCAIFQGCSSPTSSQPTFGTYAVLVKLYMGGLSMEMFAIRTHCSVRVIWYASGQASRRSNSKLHRRITAAMASR